MVPGHEVLGVRSLARSSPRLRGEEVPDAPPVAPMSGSRLLSWRGAERLEEVDLVDVIGMADARYAVEVAAAGGHHLMLSGPKGAGQDHARRAVPGMLPDLTLDEALELTAIHSLAGACAPGTGWSPGRRSGAAPRRQQGQPPRRRHRPGPAGRGEPGPPRRAVPRRVPAVPRRRDRGAAPAAGERRGHHRPPRRDGDLPGPRHGGAGLQPVPLRRLPPRVPATTGARAARCARRDYRRKVAGPIADRIDIPGTSSRCGRTSRDDRFGPVRVAGHGAGPGGGAGAGRRPLRRDGAGGSTPRPGPVLRARWPLDGDGPAAARRRAVRRPAEPARRDARAPARLDGGRPARARPSRARTRWTSRCACAPASR